MALDDTFLSEMVHGLNMGDERVLALKHLMTFITRRVLDIRIMELIHMPLQVPFCSEDFVAQLTTSALHSPLKMHRYHVGYDVLFSREDVSTYVAFWGRLTEAVVTSG